MTDFPTLPVTVTMTGEEWFAISLRLMLPDMPLSNAGEAAIASAKLKLAAQLGAASNAIAAGAARPRPRLVTPEVP